MRNMNDLKPYHRRYLKRYKLDKEDLSFRWKHLVDNAANILDNDNMIPFGRVSTIWSDNNYQFCMFRKLSKKHRHKNKLARVLFNIDKLNKRKINEKSD